MTPFINKIHIPGHESETKRGHEKVIQKVIHKRVKNWFRQKVTDPEKKWNQK